MEAIKVNSEASDLQKLQAISEFLNDVLGDYSCLKFDVDLLSRNVMDNRYPFVISNDRNERTIEIVFMFLATAVERDKIELYYERGDTPALATAYHFLNYLFLHLFLRDE